MFAIGVFSFLLIGTLSVNTVNANTVVDDPPKKEVKSEKKCSDATKAKCCSGKTAVKCEDKEGKSASTSTTTKDSKKSDPDKK